MVQQCGGADFARLRVGIGRPQGGDVIAHVLGDFSAVERQTLPDVLSTAARGAESFVTEGISQAMNVFNSRKPREKGENRL